MQDSLVGGVLRRRLSLDESALPDYSFQYFRNRVATAVRRDQRRLKMRYFGYSVAVLALAVPMMAGGETPVPEINASSASAAIALLSGGLLVIKARKR